jgi:hypothetical protein
MLRTAVSQSFDVRHLVVIVMNGMHGTMDQNQEYERQSQKDKHGDPKHDDLLHGLTASITLIL